MSERDQGTWTLLAALAANAGIAITKFIVAIVSGSAGLFAEGMHSIVDTGDSVLLLIGQKLSKRPATANHPYGHGQEAYFWTIIVAMSVFGMGGCLSIYRGIHHLGDTRMPEAMVWSYIVLGVSFLFEGTSWLISLKSVSKQLKRRGLWQTLERSKDSARIAVILEDSGALIGIVIAVTGLALTNWLQMPVFDAISSILIGALLVAIGIILGLETRSLLLGESATPETVASIRTIARGHHGVTKAEARTMHMGPDHVHVDLLIELEADLDVRSTMREIEAAVKGKHPEVHDVSFQF